MVEVGEMLESIATDLDKGNIGRDELAILNDTESEFVAMLCVAVRAATMLR
jgi:hypothetical protein